jgi:phospholipid/cholesterol/gamma-HCH transport system ATP-binding protein
MSAASASEVVIEVDDLTAGYGETAILEGISFQVMAGEILVILGGSGSGKTTVLKHMIGLNPPLAGSIRIHGQDLVTADEAIRKDLMRHFGVMYQMGALFGSMDLLENVRLPLDEFTDLPPATRDLVALMKLDLVGLRDAARLMPAEISGGMQKRAAIARAMALDPGILFLDEPSAGLDPITSAELDQLILQLNRTLGITFVVVSHELPSIFTIARRVIMLDKETRGIIASGAPRDLAEKSSHPRVRRFFNRQVEPHHGAHRQDGSGQGEQQGKESR